MAVAEELKRILACPKCRGGVQEKGMFIVCRKCGVAYPVLLGDVPDMLVEDAWKLKKAEKGNFWHSIKL